MSLYVSVLRFTGFQNLPKVPDGHMLQLGSIIQAMFMLPTRWTRKAAATKTGFLATVGRLDGKTHTHREFPEKKRERSILFSLARSLLGKPTGIELV